MLKHYEIQRHSLVHLKVQIRYLLQMPGRLCMPASHLAMPGPNPCSASNSTFLLMHLAGSQGCPSVATLVGAPDGIPDSHLQPGPAVAVAIICRVNLRMEKSVSLCISEFQVTEKQIQTFKVYCAKTVKHDCHCIPLANNSDNLKYIN